MNHYTHPHRPNTRTNRPPSSYPKAPDLRTPPHPFQVIDPAGTDITLSDDLDDLL